MMATISTKFYPKWKFLLLIWFWTLSVNLINDVASQSHNCSHVKCPPMSQISCPEDSYIRAIYEESNLLSAADNYEIVEEIFVHCCVTQKCSCRVCHIPSCHNTSLVLMETIPETETPGKCCGQYECIFEPNCTETINSNGHWLTDCQRCECVSGERICHRSCDEDIIMPPRNCISQNLNRFYGHGDTWHEDDCTVCECNNGKNKCQTSFCRQLDCEKKIKLAGECCPMCAPDDIGDVIIVTTSPTSTSTTIKTEEEKQISNITEEIPDIISTMATSTTTQKPIEEDIPETELPILKPILVPETTSHYIPSTTANPTLTFSIQNSDSVQVTQPPVPQYSVCYTIIAVLGVLLAIFIGLYFYERAKQRSYDPVPSTDDNSNSITAKIKIIETA